MPYWPDIVADFGVLSGDVKCVTIVNKHDRAFKRTSGVLIMCSRSEKVFYD